MYKINFNKNIKKIIKEENINQTELTSLIQEDLINQELEEKQDIIFILDINNKQIALIGFKDKKDIIINHISTNPIIVDKK